MANPFAHIELNTDDLARAKKFYKSLFKWKLGVIDGGYTMIDVGKGTGGGMQKKPVPASPTTWLPYVEVDDVKETIADAKKLGAKIMVDYMDIGDMGAIGVFTDPSGATLGVWAMARKSKKDKKGRKDKKDKKRKKDKKDKKRKK